MPVLGYWDIRGMGYMYPIPCVKLAQPIRLLLHYVGEIFEDKQYSCGPAPEYKKEDWMKEKLTLGLDFPNLPYYIDGDVKITQSNAILRYLARKHKLDGETEAEKVLVDVMENTAMDFRNGAVRLFYNQKFEELKPGYLKELKAKLEQFEGYMKEKKFFAGEKVTFVDFPMYELLDQHRVLDPSCLDDCPSLKAFMDRVEDLPAIKTYMASESFMSKPINNKMAQFGTE